MKIKVKIDATFQSEPVAVELEIDMEISEMKSYAKEVLPELVKNLKKLNK